MKGLYHYTSTFHLPQILSCDYLKLTRGILDDYAVWFTTSITPSGNGLEGSVVDKGEIRFVMKDILAIKWKDYRKKFTKGKDRILREKWADALEVNQKPGTWWLTTDFVTLDNVQAIENIRTGIKIDFPAPIDEILDKLI
ncbi:hypothetical protein [Clostridium sp. JS66]|uniref:hypothetical protein n=1 Tax=Clostridium sp. JS66 TaxID=3064705 RepID=UPI00298D6BC5|nr:hypothetical protein [Clostridium sp. JS66]WPC42926.1 hypothetical protein Q6H37_05495 [Clostridium sp. JS66]